MRVALNLFPLSSSLKIMKSPRPLTILRFLLQSIGLVSLLFILEVLVMILVDGRGPNHFELPVSSFLKLFPVLWDQNVMEALNLLARQPLVMIAHLDKASDTTLWSFYIFPTTVLIHLVVAGLAVAVFAAREQDADAKTVVLALVATGLPIIAVTHVTMVAHCSGPTWMVDVMLRAARSPFNETAAFWQKIPLNVPKAFFITQCVLALAGIALFIRLLLVRMRGTQKS
jgi:hypothetical protein